MMNLRWSFVLAFCLILHAPAFSQKKDVKLPANWFNLDLLQDGYFGISTEKTYKELLADRKPKERIVVAVIDGGIDIGHEDLKGMLWVNKKEIAGNDIDDDGNGYIDDVNGWNFIGSKRGNLAYDNLELTRIRRKFLPKFMSTTNLTVLDSAQKEEFSLYQKATQEFGRKYDEAHQSFSYINMITKVLDSVAVVNHKIIPTLEEIDKYTADNEEEEQIKKFIRSGAKEKGGMEKFYKEMKDAYKQYDVMLKYNLNLDYDPRSELVGDNYNDSKQRVYGNSDVVGPNAEHGSHVAGIIGANRTNNIGIKGVADYVSIIGIRVVPEGDERDKDVANGIRYAVDNGARIINMSFGKGFKWDKKIVDEAVKYAEEKGVLLIHAAGNDNSDNDVEENYPNKYFETPESTAYKKAHKKESPKIPVLGTRGQNQNQDIPNRGMGNVAVKPVPIDTIKFNLPHASNWIEVGASAYSDDGSLKASFSNYGKYSVDVFAPGFMINSTVPGSKYEEFDGTSMASPVVAGLAALMLSYYPELKPAQVREIIMKSVVKVDHKVKHTNSKGEAVRVNFSELCASGGIVNAYNAMKMAANYVAK